MLVSPEPQLTDPCSTLVRAEVEMGMKKGLNVMLAIGEQLSERKDGTTVDVCARQIKAVISKVTDWSKAWHSAQSHRENDDSRHSAGATVDGLRRQRCPSKSVEGSQHPPHNRFIINLLFRVQRNRWIIKLRCSC